MDVACHAPTSELDAVAEGGREHGRKLCLRELAREPLDRGGLSMDEDDATQRERVRLWLEPQQWLVTEAENGRTAPDAVSLALINCKTPMISFSWFFIGTVRNDCERYPVL